MIKRRRRPGKLHGFEWKYLTLAVVAVISVPLAVYALFFQHAPVESARASEPTVAAPTEAPPAAVVAFIGDSYTGGAGGTGGGFPALLAASQGWTIQNFGVGGTGYVGSGDQNPSDAQNACGQDYCPSYTEMIDDVSAARPDVVVVSGGRNSTWAERATLEASIREFFTGLRGALPDASIIVTSPLWDDDEAPAELHAIAGIVEAHAAEVGAVYLDLGQPLAGRADLLSADGVHPNDAGYAAIADAIATRLG